MGPLIPLFWISGDVCPGFQSQGGSLFACFVLCELLDCEDISTKLNRLSLKYSQSWLNIVKNVEFSWKRKLMYKRTFIYHFQPLICNCRCIKFFFEFDVVKTSLLN